MRGRGKRVALGAAGTGIVVLVAAGITLKDWIREEYWLWRLRRGLESELHFQEDREQYLAWVLKHKGDTHGPEVRRAAEALAEMESLKAVPVLLESLGSSVRFIESAVSRPLQEGVPERPPNDIGDREINFWIWRIRVRRGKEFLPVLMGALHAEEDRVRLGAGITLANMGNVGSMGLEAIPVLAEIAENKWHGPAVREAATMALRRIRAAGDTAPTR